MCEGSRNCVEIKTLHHSGKRTATSVACSVTLCLSAVWLLVKQFKHLCVKIISSCSVNRVCVPL